MRRMLQHLRDLCISFVRAILGCAAEIEFFFWADTHSSRQMFRRLWLQTHRANIQGRVFLGTRIMIRGNGKLLLGDRCAIGSFARIWKYSDIEIGEDFMSAGALTINTGGHDINTMEPFSEPVKIGHRVWCGVNVTILSGVTIGDDVVIAAGAVVTRDVPSGVVWGGVPGKELKKIAPRDPQRFWRPTWHR